ncbi:MAG: SDR family oxidoreductase [Nitratireductor sp.]|nr:SDR family oxidoreductase [Nitratireductor sp.]
MKLDLGGRRAIVAGGSRGIGFATALAFAQAGVSVSICARNAEGLENARLSLARTGATIHAMPCDMSDPAAIETYVSSAAEALGGIDILVNNCTGQSSGNTEEDWAKVIAVDLMGTVRATAAARIHLEKSGDGRVINISSRTALGPSPHTQPYGAIKAGLMQLTTSQAAELARGGIRVNCVAPGSTDIPGGWWEKCKARNPDLYSRTLESFPFGRFGLPEDIAGVILFLASPPGSWITGQTILVDGGQTLGI